MEKVFQQISSEKHDLMKGEEEGRATLRTGASGITMLLSISLISPMESLHEILILDNCSLSLWRVVRGSKLMHLVSLIHGLFIT